MTPSPCVAILIAAQSLMAFTAVVQTVAVVTGRLTLPLLCALALLGGVGMAFDLPARQTFLSEMVPIDDLQNAVSLGSTVFNGGRIVGQAVAGVLVSLLGYAWCFGINAASYGAIIVAYIAMRTAELRSAPRAVRARGQIGDGLRYVRRTPVLRTVILLLLAMGIFSLNFQVFVPLIAKDGFGGKEGKVALFQVLMALGALTGALLAARRRGPSSQLLVRSALAYSLALGAIALSTVEPVTWVFLVIGGISSMTFLNTTNASLQVSSNPAIRGRVMALYALVLVGTAPVGAPLIGWLADVLGPRQSVGVAAVSGLLVTFVAARARRDHLLEPGLSSPDLHEPPTSTPAEA